jgi:hypothetical protein
MEEVKITTEKMVEVPTNWLQDELENVKETSFDGDRKPALKLEENIPTKMIINFAEPFQKWEDNENNVVKKIIPVTVNGVESVWWLNVRNPIYNKIITLGAGGQEEFTVLQTGTQKNTKYILIGDDK